METLKQEVLNGILDGLFKEKIDLPKTIKTYTYDDIKKLNKIKIRNIKLNKVENTLALILNLLNDVNEDYKELINRTEFWERKSTINYDFENWNTIKKVNGRITRYYNDLLKIKKRLEKK